MNASTIEIVEEIPATNSDRKNTNPNRRPAIPPIWVRIAGYVLNSRPNVLICR